MCSSDLARSHGVNFIDTADVYTKGASESMVGRLLQSQRHDWVLATKLGNQMGSGPNQQNYSRTWIMREVEESLRRLATDFVDILYLHRDFSGANLEEPVRAMGDLIRAGKIRYWAVSNFRGWRIAEIAALCDKLGVPRPVACQPYYNLLRRTIEWDLLPQTERAGTGVIAFCPLASGLLTSKYLGGIPADSRAALRWGEEATSQRVNDRDLEVVRGLNEIAQARGQSLAQMALAWILRLPSITSALIGASRPEQILENVGALKNLAFAPEELAAIDALTKARP